MHPDCRGEGAGPHHVWLPSPCRWCLAPRSCAPSPALRLWLSPHSSAGGSAVPSARPWPVPSVRERLPRMAKVRAAGWLLSPRGTQPACRRGLLCPVAPCPGSAPPGSARAPRDAGRAWVMWVRLSPLPAQLMLPLGTCPMPPLPRCDLPAAAPALKPGPERPLWGPQHMVLSLPRVRSPSSSRDVSPSTGCRASTLSSHGAFLSCRQEQCQAPGWLHLGSPPLSAPLLSVSIPVINL